MTGTVWSKFYWSDWLSESGLRKSSLAARGIWIDMLCIAAQADPIGYLTVSKEPLSVHDIARMVGGSEPEVVTLIEELERNGVLSRDRNGTIYNRRMVRDAKKAKIAQKNGKTGGNPTLGNNKRNSASDNPPDKGGLKPQRPEASIPEARELASASSSGARAIAIPISSDWQPSEASAKRRHDAGWKPEWLSKEAGKFRAYHRARGHILLTDWDAEFDRWLERAAKEYPLVAPSTGPAKQFVEICSGSGEWNAWQAYFADEGKRASLSQMREAEACGKPFAVETYWPPGHRQAA